jgi:phosphonate transport system substrate-binding protein
MQASPSKSHNFWITLIVCLIFMVPLVGCDSASKYQYVDFKDHVEVARPSESAPEKAPLKVAVAAMISPRETFEYYQALLDYLTAKMDQPIELVQRKTYGEINELFLKKQLDLAFICTGPYATSKEIFGFDAIATPQVRGKPTYQSYLIVKKDSAYTSIEDLRGKEFAFTDPESNTGSLVPRFWLAEIGESPSSFFRQTIYTYSHDNSIKAVSKGLVDAAAVDGHKWDYYQVVNPSLTEATRIIKKSDPFGSPPLVAASNLALEKKKQIQTIVISMHQDEDGRQILERLMIDRFVVPDESWYASVKTMHQVLQAEGNFPHAAAKSQ